MHKYQLLIMLLPLHGSSSLLGQYLCRMFIHACPTSTWAHPKPDNRRNRWFRNVTLTHLAPSMEMQQRYTKGQLPMSNYGSLESSENQGLRMNVIRTRERTQMNMCHLQKVESPRKKVTEDRLDAM